jgi:hypothetical protein
MKLTLKTTSFGSVSKEDQEQLARLADRYALWLHPDLIAQVAQANLLAPTYGPPSALPEVPKFIPEAYLWEGSTCFYPGIRRKVGKDERGYKLIEKNAFRADGTGNAKAEDVLHRLAPAQIKSRAQLKKANTLLTAEEEGEPLLFKGGYHLVHLFPHKPTEVARLLKASEVTTSDSTSKAQWESALKTGFPGMFTSAANMCLLPGELTRPTDANSKVRDVLWYRALQLYGINFLPPLLRSFAQRLRDNPPLDRLPDEVNCLGEKQSAVAWAKTDKDRKTSFNGNLREWHKRK